MVRRYAEVVDAAGDAIEIEFHFWLPIDANLHRRRRVAAVRRVVAVLACRRLHLEIGRLRVAAGAQGRLRLVSTPFVRTPVVVDGGGVAAVGGKVALVVVAAVVRLQLVEVVLMWQLAGVVGAVGVVRTSDGSNSCRGTTSIRCLYFNVYILRF